MSAFGGFPPELFAFFAALEGDNSKSFWNAHKTHWERHVRGPMNALLDELTEEFGQLRMFRPNRDIRFSKDKSPYKLWAGATSESRAVGGIGYYIEVSATRMVTGYGAMAMTSDQLARFRAAIDDETSGQAFAKLHHELTSQSSPLTHGIDPPLKTPPRGYTSDHPRIELLRWKGAAIVREWDKADWMHTPEALDTVRDIWRSAAPLKAWLDVHVGAANEPKRTASSQQGQRSRT
ncbi:DUF2461 domain-containing protein [Micromonospora sp. CPCC 206061]|uniref:DUF2461 domain-containing protein n=1 Tax=Micromonospora sp. CPCC 206061 TaxID=3122410 RepID=UPI002FF32291